MPLKLSAAFILLFALSGSTLAFEGDSSSIAGSAVSDHVTPDADSLNDTFVSGSIDSLPVDKSGTLSSGTPKPASVSHGETQKLQLIKRKYNSRQQVFLATSMMIFVVGIMTMAQQWNPR